jgi:hypothetical protein
MLRCVQIIIQIPTIALFIHLVKFTRPWNKNKLYFVGPANKLAILINDHSYTQDDTWKFGWTFDYWHYSWGVLFIVTLFIIHNIHTRVVFKRIWTYFQNLVFLVPSTLT